MDSPTDTNVSEEGGQQGTPHSREEFPCRPMETGCFLAAHGAQQGFRDPPAARAEDTGVCVCDPGASPYQSRLLVDLRACGEKSVAGVGFQVDLVTLWGTHTEGAFP